MKLKPRRPVRRGPKPNNDSTPRHKIGRRRLWVFRLAALLLAPLIFVALLEGALRLVGFGYNPDFIIPDPQKEGALTVNRQFTWRFFPPKIARQPKPFRIAAEKPADTYRIFLLGASAAQGDPDFTYGMARALEAQLEHRHPGRDFEIVNTAITAINSHVVRTIAAECARYEPDLFVVYLGNNEVVGPYGPGTVFSELSSSLALIRLNIWLKGTKTGQFFERLTRAFGMKREPESWGGMELFVGKRVRSGDPRLQIAYEHFRRNLRAIVDSGTRVGAPVLLSTVGVNLKDNAPFASLHGRRLSAEEEKDFDEIYEKAIALETAGEMENAITAYRRALEIDDRYADLQFRLARALWNAGEFDEAREHYLHALELDALRFRADERINRTIREVAERAEGDVHFLDLAEAITEQSPRRTPGIELFYEHVHFNFSGNALAGRELARRIETLLPEEIRESAPPAIEWLDDEALARRLCFTGYDERRIAANVLTRINRAPFSAQLDHEKWIAYWKQRIEDLDRFTRLEGLREADRIYRRALAEGHADWVILNRYAAVRHALGDFEGAAEQLRIALEAMPYVAEPHYNYGLMLYRLGDYEKAAAEFRRAGELDPTMEDAWFSLGDLLARLGRLDEAMEAFARGEQAVPRLKAVQHYLNIGTSLLKQEAFEAGRRLYARAAELDPDNASAHHNLAIALASLGRNEEALEYFQRAIAIDPQMASAHNNLGKLRIQMGDRTGAAAAFERALQIDPQFAEARANLEALKSGMTIRVSPGVE